MRAYHRLGSVLGIEIGIHVSWYVVFLLLAYSLGSGFFPTVLVGESSLTYSLMGIAASFLLFLSVLAHELSHSFVARFFRLKIDRIYLFFFGGISQIHEDGLSPKSEILMALAGPVFSLVFAFVCAMLAPLINSFPVSAVVAYLARINLMLGLFNLLPGFPLDGGRVLRGLVWWKTGRYELATAYASKSGKFLGALMGVSGLVSVLFGDFGGLWMALIGVFLFVMAESSFEQMLLKKSLSSKSVSSILEKNPLTVHSSLPVERLVNEYFLKLPLDRLPVVDDGRFRGVVELDRIVRVRPELRRSILVKDVMVLSDKVPALSPHDSLYAALDRMSSSRVDLLPVIDGRKLLGIVTRESLIHFLRASALMRDHDVRDYEEEGSAEGVPIGKPVKRSAKRKR
ncbi:MAG: site-2 protease family protein [Nanoarchaeota archaeon]